MHLHWFQALVFSAGGFCYGWATQLIWPGTSATVLLSLGTVLFIIGLIGPYAWNRYCIPRLRNEQTQIHLARLAPKSKWTASGFVIIAVLLVIWFANQ